MTLVTLIRSIFEKRRNGRVEREKRILLHHLPDLIWRLVFRHLTTNLQVAESCAEASLFFHDFILQSFENVSIGPEQILPSVYREWSTKSHFRKRSTEWLLKIMDMKPRISTFDIFVTTKFRPDNNVLNSFLKCYSESLHTLHIYCMGIEEKPIVLTFPENNKLRVLKMVRLSMEYLDKVSLRLPQPICSVLAALESLTLSVSGRDYWTDFLQRSDSAKLHCKALKHLCFVDYESDSFSLSDGILLAAGLFRNLVSFELPARHFASDHLGLFALGRINLKRLTLDGGPDLDVHCFDKLITQYDEETCKAILRNPERDPQEIHWEIQQEKGRQLATRIGYNLNRLNSRYRWTQNRGPKVRATFSKLKVLRMKCGNGNFGPTRVCIPDLLNMASLKQLEFIGGYPKHIPEEMLNILRTRFQVLCVKNTES